MTPYLQQRTLYPPLINEAPAPDLGMVVVIPAFDEGKLLDSLISLLNCELPSHSVEVIVVINEAEDSQAEIKRHNREVYASATAWAVEHSKRNLQFHIFHCQDLPHKHAGVGLARKIGMDEACRRLEQAGHPDGIILGFDADSRCDPDYFTAVESYFQQHPSVQAASLYFEHPLQGEEYPAEVYTAVTLYELHLRYFINAQRWLRLPYAYQTVGSSMAVRCRAYEQQGGMNRRKAGEDFYFLHKFTKLGRYGEINTTRVIPSPRPSQRVPFGTGRAVLQLVEKNLNAHTYAPQGFRDLQALTEQLAGWYERADLSSLPLPLKTFLESVHITERLAQIRQHTASQDAFVKRFYRWFDAFLMMKYLHFVRDHYYEDVPTVAASSWLAGQLGTRVARGATANDLLYFFRHYDRVHADDTG